MNVSFRHTRTGLLALAAAGILAAGAVADRANRLYATDTAQQPPAAEQVRLADGGPGNGEALAQ